MATLNNWQRFDRPGLFGGQPWGTGAAGDATISSDPNTRATYTGSADSTSGTAGSTAFANGDAVIIHQTQGTGAGQWECNKVASGGGTTSLVMAVANKYTYGTGAQIIKVPQYLAATVSAHSVTGWNGTTGGVEVILAKTSITVSGAINASGLGFQGHGESGGSGLPDNIGYNGYGTGASVSRALTANGNGGGGGARCYGGGTSHAGGGGGGGNAATGGTGKQAQWDGTFQGANAAGGSSVGSADLITICMGGGGGKGGDRYYEGKASGAGGGIVFLITKTIDLSSAGVNSVGGGGGGAYDEAPSGGGAGGSVIVICSSGTLGTNGIVATGGAGGTSGAASQYGGAGSVGRIAVHHSGTVTGTTNPTFTDTTDLTLVEKTGMFLAFM